MLLCTHTRPPDKSYKLNSAAAEHSDDDVDDDTDVVAVTRDAHEEVALISSYCQILSKLQSCFFSLGTERFQSSAASERKTSEDFKRNFEMLGTIRI